MVQLAEVKTRRHLAATAICATIQVSVKEAATLTIDLNIILKKLNFYSHTVVMQGKSVFLYQAVNMFNSALKLDILKWEPMVNDLLLEPLVDVRGMAVFHASDTFSASGTAI